MSNNLAPKKEKQHKNLATLGVILSILLSILIAAGFFAYLYQRDVPLAPIYYEDSGPTVSFDIPEERTLIGLDNIGHLSKVGSISGYSWIETLDFSPQGHYMAWAGWEGVWVHDISNGQPLINLTGFDYQVHDVHFGSDEAHLFTGSYDSGGGKLRLWDWKSQDIIWAGVAASQDWGARLALAPDGEWLVTNGGGEHHLWQIQGETLERMRTLPVGGVPVISPDGQFIALADFTRIHILDSHGDLLYDMTPDLAPGEVIHDPVFSPNSEMMAAPLSSGDLHIWETGSGKLIVILKTGPAGGYRAAFSPAGDLLVCGNFDGEIQFWTTSDFKLLRKIKAHEFKVSALQFSPDGSLLASGSEDYNLYLWAVTP